jgi:hypothetical protein
VEGLGIVGDDLGRETFAGRIAHAFLRVRDIGIKYICCAWKISTMGFLVQANYFDIMAGGAGTGQGRAPLAATGGAIQPRRGMAWAGGGVVSEHATGGALHGLVPCSSGDASRSRRCVLVIRGCTLHIRPRVMRASGREMRSRAGVLRSRGRKLAPDGR